jgi:hypothetical protein
VYDFSLFHIVHTSSGAHPDSYPIVTSGFSPGVKRPRREADHSTPPSAEDQENVDLYVDSPIHLHGVVLN